MEAGPKPLCLQLYKSAITYLKYIYLNSIKNRIKCPNILQDIKMFLHRGVRNKMNRYPVP